MKGIGREDNVNFKRIGVGVAFRFVQVSNEYVLSFLYGYLLLGIKLLQFNDLKIKKVIT